MIKKELDPKNKELRNIQSSEIGCLLGIAKRSYILVSHTKRQSTFIICSKIVESGRSMSISVFTLELDKQVEVILSRLSDNGQIEGSFSASFKWLNTVTDVRNAIRQRTGIPHDRIDIIYGGKKLPKKYCLYQVNVSSNSIRLFYFCHSQNSTDDAWIHIVSPNPLDNVVMEESNHV